MSQVYRTSLAALLLIGLTACGGSATAAAAPVAVSVNGQLAQISGSTMTVADNQSVDTIVVFDGSTLIETSAAATAADVVVGKCVSGSGARDAGGNLAVRTLQVTSPVGGKCLPSPAAGFGRGAGATPGPRVSPNPGRSPGGPANLAQISGHVTATDGTTVTVKSDSGAVASITLAASVRVTKQVALAGSALKVGDCVVARGQKDSTGELKAATISVGQPGAAGCFFGGGRGGFGPGRAVSPSPPTS